MGQIQDRGRRIQILLTLLVIGGGLWFVKFGEPLASTNKMVNPVPTQNSLAVSPSHIEGPEPTAFDFFSLPSDEVVRRSFECGDTYYAALVFPADADYRVNPRAAVYNSANACNRGEQVTVSVALGGIQAPAGRYYLVIADQGNAGGWYNPQ